jgi:salicylate hydroxylase
MCDRRFRRELTIGKKMSGNSTILIAGAGLGGLTAAIASARRGFKVRVFEQAPKLGEIGAGVQISPSGFRVLEELGLKDEILSDCYVPIGRQMLVWNSGYSTKPILSGDVAAKYGLPVIHIHRADLHAILVRALQELQPDAIQINSRVAGFAQSGAQVELTLTNGQRFSGNVLIGADGLHSVIRHQLFGASKARFTGGISWRGMMRYDQLPEDVRPPYMQNWVGLKGHFVVYRVRRGELVNIVGHMARDDWRVESWTELGTTEEMLNDFSGWHPNVQTFIKNIDKPYKWGLFLHPTQKQWAVGRVALMGDACHPTLPYLGYGANMAFEDGLVLARCLEQFDDVEAALQRYERARIPRTTEIVEASAINGNRFHSPDLADPETAKVYIDRESIEPDNLRDWLFSYDAATVPI